MQPASAMNRMTILPEHPRRAIALGFALWLLGMAVGGVVFAFPALRNVSPIPYVSANPFITLPILTLWAVATWTGTRRAVHRSRDAKAEGVRFGMTLLVINVAMDLLVVVFMLRRGLEFYSFLGPWVAYLVLIGVPVLLGRMTPQRDQ